MSLRPRLFRRLRAKVRRFRSDRQGVSIVEFALVLPAMLALYVGAVEAGTMLSISRKVTLTAHTVADLASQYITISGSDMTTILNASTAVVAPYAVSNAIVIVSEISTDSTGKATVTWSKSLNGTPLTAGQTVTLPAAMVQPNTSLITGYVQYSYVPALGYLFTKTIALHDQIYLSPRQSSSVAYTGT